MSLDLLGTQNGDGGAADVSSTDTDTTETGVAVAGDESTAGTTDTEVSETIGRQELSGEEAEGTDDADSPAELSEEDLEALAKDEALPANTRGQIKQAWSVAGKRKEELNNLKAEYEAFKQQYEGKSYIEQAEIDRLKAAEDLELKLTSYTATPDDIFKLIEEKNPQAYTNVLKEAAWRALETEDGKPNLTNLQAFIDRASSPFGTNKVSADDVLKFVEGVASGSLDPLEMQQFGSVEEYEAHKRVREMESAARQRREMEAESLKFAEEQGRQTILSQEVGQIQRSFSQKLDAIKTQLKLTPIEGEPTVVADFKKQVNDELAIFLNTQSAQNPYLQEVMKTLERLGEAKGNRVNEYSQEIKSVLSSPGYTSRLDKGLADVSSAVEKYLAQKAAQAALIAEGYAAQQSRRPKARAVTKSPNGAVNTETLSEEEAAQLTGPQRVEYEARKLSQQLREMAQTTA